MITTAENLELPVVACYCCGCDVGPQSAVRSLPCVTGGRICVDCDNQIKRNKIPAPPPSEVERDYKAFLDGKRDYNFRGTITFADGCEITNTPVTERLAKAFRVAI